MNNKIDTKQVSLFLWCNICKNSDKNWSLRCSKCGKYRELKIDKNIEKLVSGWMWKGK